MARRFIVQSLLLLCALTLSVAHATSYYVAPGGNDYGSGLYVGSPFKTIQKAVNVARAGDTVWIRGGVYREGINISTGGGAAGNPVKIMNYNGEQVYIKGSQIVTGWTQHSGGIWKKTGWTVNSQQVFVDFNDATPTSGPKPLQQIGMPSSYYSSWEYNAPVGSGLSSMRAGSFFYDRGSKTLYVWLADGSSPNNHRMEASVQRRLIYMARPYIQVEGLKFRHSNVSGYSQQGAAIELSSNSSLKRCDIQFTDFAGVAMGYLQSNTSVTESNVSNNGNSGINSSATNNFRVAYNTLNNNNYRNFNMLWHAGGFKAATNAYGIIESNIVGYNKGSGIWFDYADSGNPIVIRYNFVHNNGPKDSGIFFEVSNNGLIHNNIIANNERRGIYLSAAWNTRVFNNTIINTRGRAGIEVAGMPRSGGLLKNNQVVNNIISHGTTSYDFALMKPNGTTISGNSSNYNNFYRSGAAPILWYGSTYTSLTSWRTATGQDRSSQNVNPNFAWSGNTPSSASNMKVNSGSPMINKGQSLSGIVTRDYWGTSRPKGTAYDIGAFEYPQ